MSQRTLIVSAGALCVATLIWSFIPERPELPAGDEKPETVSPSTSPPRQTEAAASAAPVTYVGSSACSACHEAEAASYRGSDHDRAIELPSPASVLAPFAGETFAHDGTTTKFYQKDGRHFVQALGPEGKKQDYAVAYTFGFDPLQQYLLDLGGGRLQATTVAWDSRAKAQGGQRYFSLYPGERIAHTDELHWSRPTQNWNFTCADCHTTALKKGYDESTNTFKPTFAELNVSCEACHGPGSAHLKWAQAQSDHPDAQGEGPARRGFSATLHPSGAWYIPSGARTALPRPIGDNQKELETCAPCHSRRQQLRDGFRAGDPFLDAYLPDLLDARLYEPDGQIREEDYEYGSFLQSRMFNAGVRCSDCHNPHSLELRRPGNSLCTGCHDAETFDAAAHHHHAGRSHQTHHEKKDGSACVDCHMPQTTYMQVDPRRDHSIRIPRPDLGPLLGTKDACTGCHTKQSQAWAAQQIESWTGRKPSSHYGEVFHAARASAPSAEERLNELAQAHKPAIVRATALSLLANYPGERGRSALSSAARASEPLERIGAALGAHGFDGPQRIAIVKPLLSDPLLAVRTVAQRALVGLRPSDVPASERAVVSATLEELKQTEHFNADRSDAWLRIALIEMSQGEAPQAKRSLERALELDPRFVPALVNLADLYRAQQDEAQAELLLRRAIGIDETNAEAWHALGLSLVRQQRKAEGTAMLKRATDLRPGDARMAYVYAVALGDGGDLRDAIAVLRRSLDAHPNDPTLVQMLLNYAHKSGDAALVQEMAERFAELRARGAVPPPAQ